MLLLLDATTKSIEAVSSSGPTDIVFVAAYADSTSSAFTEGSSDGAVSTTDTTIVAAPSTSTRRVIKSINFYNTAASSRTVTLKYNNNGTKRTVAVFTLTAGENWSTDDLAGGGGGISSLTVGTTPITGTNGSILYVNGSVLGEIATTGTGNIVRASSPTLTTPNLGTPSAATLTNATGLPLTTGVTGTLPVGNGGTGATSLTANNVLLGNGTSALQVVAPGANGNVLTSDGTTWTSAAPTGGGGGGVTFKNALINGDMAVAQRGTSFTSATAFVNNNEAYTLDRWYILSNGADTIDVTQATNAPTGQLYSIGLDVETTGRKFGIAQIIEQKNCVGLIGQNVSLSFKARVSSAGLNNVKAAILSWNGTADGVTSNIISSWNSAGTTPTFITNAVPENTPANLSVGTTWATYKIENVNIGTSGTNNIIVFIWSDVTATTLGDFLYITDVQLEKSATATDFERVPFDISLARCQRYAYYTGSESLSSVRMIGFGFNGSTSYTAAAVYYPVSMRVLPGMTASALNTFSANNGGSFTGDATTGTVAIGTASTRFSGFVILYGTFTNGSGNVIFATNGFVFFDAEL